MAAEGRHRLDLAVPPAILVAVLAGLMSLVAWLVPALTIPLPGGKLIAWVPFFLGVALIVAGGHAFRRAATTVDPTRPDKASSLVTEGVYRLSRNPMYLGFLLVLIAVAVALANPLTLIGPVVFVLWMNRFQILPEEVAMQRRFAEAYQAYARRTRRWL